jgi:hypothetical protein
MTDMDPDPCAVDEQMHRAMSGRPVKLDLAKSRQSLGQRCVIRDRQVRIEQPEQGAQEALSLT